jgi:hypothetical protein
MARRQRLQKWVFYYTDANNKRVRVSEKDCKSPERTKNWKEAREAKGSALSFGAMVAEDFYEYPYLEHQK